MSSNKILVEIAPGELIDKITLLNIKLDRISDQEKLSAVRHELSVLDHARTEAIEETVEIRNNEADLQKINEELWEIEDEIRRLEKNGDFGAEFIELARSVYRTNDRRAATKNRINELLGSSLKEVKDYVAYDS